MAGKAVEESFKKRCIPNVGNNSDLGYPDLKTDITDLYTQGGHTS
jgi:hypothetical protein